MIEREAADRRKPQNGFKSSARAEGLGKRCPASHVCTRSLTSGYEEIRLGSYPIVDKNKSHIHPALFSLLTVTWLRDNTAQVTINQAACLSFSRFFFFFPHASCFPVTSLWQISYLTSPEIKQYKPCSVFLPDAFIWLAWLEDLMTNSQIYLSRARKRWLEDLKRKVHSTSAVMG